MQVQSLSWEDSLEKKIATHSSILAWEIPWTEETGGLQSLGLQKSLHDLVPKTTTSEKAVASGKILHIVWKQSFQELWTGHVQTVRERVKNELKKEFVHV